MARKRIDAQFKAVILCALVFAFAAACKVLTEASKLGWNFAGHRISMITITGLEAVSKSNKVTNLSRKRPIQAIPGELYFCLENRQSPKLRYTVR